MLSHRKLLLIVIVRCRETRDKPWTLGLEWNAEAFVQSDLAHFDYALINATTHSATGAALAPVTHEGRWRLYPVSRGAE